MLRFGDELMAWASQQIAQRGDKRKSIHLPAGLIAFRKQGAKVVIDDEAVVIAWAKQRQLPLVRVSEELIKEALNQHIEKTGEIPDHGLHIEPEQEKFYVK